jgi:ElaB/YqjD/DUF883 family membrane-anchored ribosome-binding protein
MLTAHPSTVTQKRDLHVGGLGSSRANHPSIINPVSDELANEASSWLERARDAEVFIRTNPWTAVALVGLVGLAAGIAISRRA